MIAAAFRSIAGRLRPAKPGPLVIVYHRIAETDYDPWRLAVTPSLFDDQLAMLKRDREVMPLADFGRHLRQGTLPRRAAAITFDDGYACNAQVAAPMLRAHGLPATFFLTTGAIGGLREFWWDELARLVIETQRPANATVTIAGQSFSVDFAQPLVSPRQLLRWRALTRSSHARLRLYSALWTQMRRVSHAEQTAALDAAWRVCGIAATVRAEYRPMTRAEACALAQDPLFRISPHTATHPALAGLSEAAQRHEIVGSLVACRGLSDRAATFFAYPYGDFSVVTERIVQETGFELACSTRAAGVHADTNRYAIPRLQAPNLSAIPTRSLFDALARA